MTELGHELFLLMVTLSQLRDSERTLALFVDAVDAWSPDVDVSLADADQPEEPEHERLSVASTRQRFAELRLRFRARPQPGIVELLRNAAQMLALVLDKQAQDAEAERRQAALEEAVEERTRHLEAARRELTRELATSQAQRVLSEELAEELGPQQIADVVAKTAKELTGSAMVMVATCDLAGQTTFTALGAGDPRAYGFSGPSVDPGRPTQSAPLGLWSWALEQRSGFYTNDAAKHEAFSGHCKSSLLRSALATPVLVGNNAVGLIAMANPCHERGASGYDAKDLDVIGRVAEVFSAALERQLWRQERSRLEHQLRQTQKLEAVGTLAGGIAHDFNNLLMAITGFTELAYESIDDEQIREDLSGALEASGRARDLIRQLLAFSRRSEPQPEPLNLPDIAEQVLRMVRATLPSSIEIAREWPLEPLIVLADRVQLEQVLVNLCTNAAQAMAEGGRLELRAELRRYDDDDTLPAEILPGDYAALIVIDSGKGMDATTLERIFEPYYTTKEGGSGIGLAVVHGILRDHGGGILVDSVLGEGSRFEVLLPLADDEARGEVRQLEVSLGHGERLLVVDDEPLLASLGARSLERLGYRVVAETEPLAALARFRQDPDAFDLVITDQTMPKLTGIRLLSALRELRPELPIVLVTGYSETIDAEKARKLGASAFALKPLRLVELSRILRTLLDP